MDGNPDKPIGIGFVPNMAAPSMVTSKHRDLNVMRSWGGNELVMDDTPGKERVILSTSGNKLLEDYDKHVEGLEAVLEIAKLEGEILALLGK